MVQKKVSGKACTEERREREGERENRVRQLDDIAAGSYGSRCLEKPVLGSELQDIATVSYRSRCLENLVLGRERAAGYKSRKL